MGNLIKNSNNKGGLLKLKGLWIQHGEGIVELFELLEVREKVTVNSRTHELAQEV